MGGKPFDIRERAFQFAREVLTFARAQGRREYVLQRVAAQLASAAGSVAANLEEAAAAHTRADFIYKNALALKECRETRVWLRLVASPTGPQSRQAADLIQEASELIAILSTIVIRAKQGTGDS